MTIPRLTVSILLNEAKDAILLSIFHSLANYGKPLMQLIVTLHAMLSQKHLPLKELSSLVNLDILNEQFIEDSKKSIYEKRAIERLLLTKEHAKKRLEMGTGI